MRHAPRARHRHRARITHGMRVWPRPTAGGARVQPPSSRCHAPPPHPSPRTSRSRAYPCPSGASGTRIGDRAPRGGLEEVGRGAGDARQARQAGDETNRPNPRRPPRRRAARLAFLSLAPHLAPHLAPRLGQRPKRGRPPVAQPAPPSATGVNSVRVALEAIRLLPQTARHPSLTSGCCQVAPPGPAPAW